MSIVRRGEEEICERYRPRRVSEIVGNDGMKKALKKAMEIGDNRQKAYLFQGDRGSGKTTTARIMAMGLNCETGDTVEPCLECESCRVALNGNSMHIIEMNLSQLNKKEDADNIVNEMAFPSFTGRNKVYILDEAQLLTNSAQNLLLKNLEKPPKNTYVFICTTEPEKLIKTIRDRCEEYKFSFPSVDNIKLMLKDVFQQEKDWDLSKDDKVKFLEQTGGMSARGVLKSIDKVVRGGLSVLTELTEEVPGNLCRLVMKSNWKGIVSEIKRLEKDNKLEPEKIRKGMLGYMSAVLMNGDIDNMNSLMCFEMMRDCFSKPYYDEYSESKAKLKADLFSACIISKSYQS